MSETQPTPHLDLKTHIRNTWHRLRYRVTGKSSRVRDVTEPDQISRVRVIEPEERSLAVDSLENARAADYFIRAIRDPRRYIQDPYNATSLRNDIDLVVMKPLETGFFYASPVVITAAERYGLPMAMYITGQHARLILKAPYSVREGVWRVPVYDPMTGGITRVEKPRDTKFNSVIFPNGLAEQQLQSGEYDITFLKDPTLSRYHDAVLLRGKFQALQIDYSNCIPYCLFVNAMLNGLKLGDTDFKTRGIPQFQKDFGVRIRTREEITGLRVRVK